MRWREQRPGVLGPDGLPTYVEQISTRVMEHPEYFAWLPNLDTGKVQLVSAEQVED